MNTRETREGAEAAAAAWIARRELHVWSKTDQAALAEWIGQSLDHRVAWLRVSTAWEKPAVWKRALPPAKTRVCDKSLQAGCRKAFVRSFR